MTNKQIYEQLKYYFKSALDTNNIHGKSVVVAEEGFSGNINQIERFDLPLLDGAEITLVAEYAGAIGLCSTSAPARFKGTLAEALELDLNDDRERSIFIAVLNAVMNMHQLADDCLPCEDSDVDECAKHIAYQYAKNNGRVNVLVAGYHQNFIERLSEKFPLRVLDLDPSNIGRTVCGITIEHGTDNFRDAVDWADVVLCTGSSISNGTLINYINISKDCMFYGTTIAAAARVIGLRRFCPYARN